MGIFRLFLLNSLLFALVFTSPLMAEEDEIIPETEQVPAISVPPMENSGATPPIIIDESDASEVSDPEDDDN